MIQSLRCTYSWVNEIFIGIQWYLTVAYYLWLTSISRASKSVFPFFFFFFGLSFPPFFVPLHQRVSVFIFIFFFFLIFSSFLCGYFQTFQFSLTHSFFEVLYRNNKAQKESLWHKPLFEWLFIFHGSIYLCILCFSFHSIPLSFASTCISFFFFPYLFLFCVDIFKLFTQTQALTNVFPKVFPFYFYIGI